MNKTRKNAFTLIELLAVIVVLAILALIAVPIVLNIIKDARNNSNKRSIESYARAIDYAVSEYMAENPDVEVVTWEDVKDKVEYKGKVECQWGKGSSSISPTGEITLHGCKVNNKTNSIYGYVNGKVTEENEIVYTSYNVGDEITYKGMKFYVIVPSDTKQEYVTLLKDEPLTVEEVNTYGAGHVNMYVASNTSASDYQKAYNKNGYGGMAYYSSSTCGYPTAGSSTRVSSGCTNDYKASEIKYVVDGWANAKLIQEDLKEVEDYKARLITKDELLNYMSYSSDITGNDSTGYWYSKTNDTPNWVYNDNYDCWTMSPYNDSTSTVWVVGYRGALYGRSGSWGNGYVLENINVVRPVINLLKSAI